MKVTDKNMPNNKEPEYYVDNEDEQLKKAQKLIDESGYIVGVECHREAPAEASARKDTRK